MVQFAVNSERSTSGQDCSTSDCELCPSDRWSGVQTIETLVFELQPITAHNGKSKPKYGRRGPPFFAAIGLDAPSPGRGNQASGRLLLGVCVPDCFHVCHPL